MKRMMRYGFIAACLVIGILMIAGCGGDDDKGTGVTGLTAQEQFDQLNTFVTFDPNGQGDGYFNVSDLMLTQSFTQFWDGIDESDFDNIGDFLGGGLSASASAIADTSLSFTYDPVGGWWSVNFLLTQAYPQFGFTASVAVKDSVRYENSSGTAQMIPDEATTNRVMQRATVVVALGFQDQGNVITMDAEAGSNIDATGLTTSVVNITGDGDYTFGIGATGNGGSVDMTIGMQSSWNDVSITDPGGSSPCPTSGDISGSFTLGIDVQDNTGHYQADGTWDVGILFTGGGNTTVNVQSGDFDQSYTGNVCTK